MIFVGDTRMSDGGAFTTLRDATGWESRAFIGRDEPARPAETTVAGDLTFANRWVALRPFAAGLDAAGFCINAETVVVVDLDKTLLGARGRNDRLIDRARLSALRDSVAGQLGERFDQQQFEHIYRAVDTPRFHPLTADNQDYVGYLCVIIAGQVFSLAHMEALAERGVGGGPAALLAMVEDACEVVGWPSAAVMDFHRPFAELANAGDPTPFKAFRRREFAETAALMGQLPENAPAEQLLAEELVITGEVWEALIDWKARGALLFGLSDKPDEAAVPAPDDSTPPLHRIRTHIVGT
jgi:hypothetical protein